MTIAEIKGKLPSELTKREDLLTSDVFGTLKNIDRRCGLKKFLSKFGVEIADNEAEEAKFDFWAPFEEGTEPDVTIDIGGQGGYLIVVEAKYLQELNEEQLVREYRLGIKNATREGKSFCLICVTRDYVKPKGIIDSAKSKISDEIGVEPRKVKIEWINWQEILSLLKYIQDEKDIDLPSKRQVGDLIRLLEHKGLQYFRGFKEDGIKIPEKVWDKIEETAIEVSKLALNLNSELEKHGILPWEKEKRIERDGTSRKLLEPEEWITSFYALPYYKGGWWRELSLYDAILFVKIFLRPFEIWVGCSVEENRREIKTKEYYEEEFTTGDFFSWLTEEDFEESGISDRLEPERVEHVKSLTNGSYKGRLVIFDKVPLNDLVKNRALEIIVNKVVKFAEIVPELIGHLKRGPQEK